MKVIPKVKCDVLNPCEIHRHGKYLKWKCGSEYSPKERHERFLQTKIPCQNCGALSTVKWCRKCRGKFVSSHLLGKKLPKWWKDRISQGQGKGEQSKQWKGESVDYWTKHKGLVKSYGNPVQCTNCGILGKKNKGGRWTIQWANKTGIYTRKIEDYIGLCTKCHCIFDGKVKNPAHGTVARYRKGCRCVDCIDYRKLYRKGLVIYK